MPVLSRNPYKNRVIGTQSMVKTVKGGIVKFRSRLEMQCARALDASASVESYMFEPKKLRIPYTIHGGGKVYNKKYTPDFFVKYTDGSTAIIEVKPSDQRTWLLNLHKWAAAQKMCEASGMKFLIVDDKMLKNL